MSADLKPISGIALWRTRLRDKVLLGLGRLVRHLCLPGFVSNVSFDDLVTGQHFSVRSNLLFTVISVDGRDYYFHRLTGKFDGTGYAFPACRAKPPRKLSLAK